MEHLDLDKSGTISMNEFDSSGVTSTGGGEDEGGAQVSNLQGSRSSNFILFFKHLNTIFKHFSNK